MNEKRFVLDDIVRDPAGALGIVAFVSSSRQNVLCEYGGDEFKLFKADELTLYMSFAAADARKQKKQIREGR